MWPERAAYPEPVRFYIPLVEIFLTVCLGKTRPGKPESSSV